MCIRDRRRVHGDIISPYLQLLIKKTDKSRLKHLQSATDFQHFPQYFTMDPADLSEIISPNENAIGGLYISSLMTARNKELLEFKKISHVVSLLGSSDPKLELDDPFVQKLVGVDDLPYSKISQYFEDCIKFIDEARLTGNVLVHCAAGVSRSPAIVIAYLIKKNAMTFLNAQEFVKVKRYFIQPNPGFVRQLKLYETRLTATVVIE
eukprot:TRINITY_DN13863_c0_g1_i2.p1 TRINITY_DN13863_c0_g1~~TRINITY_DN13863_c0_g1_i2.p1  ORF type:complete len:227 (+),score=37.63 TRINITY_DN13863_c0_g1_i2:61-681(+)